MTPNRMTKPADESKGMDDDSRSRVSGADSVSLGRLLKPECIHIFAGKSEKHQVIEKLAGCICGLNSFLDAEFIIKRIINREREISTLVDTGLLIPHARIDDIDEFYAAFGIASEGIDDASQPGIPIKAVFLFVSPSGAGFFKKHLELLSYVSSFFQPMVIEKISSLQNSRQIFDAIVQNEHLS